MPVQVRVTITFEATDEAEAEATVEGWTLHSGSVVTMATDAQRSGTAGTDGTVALELPAPLPPPSMPA